jgi:hypothetical protein
MGSATAGCASGGVGARASSLDIRTRGGPTRCGRAFLGRPRRIDFTIVGSAGRRAAVAPSDGAFLEPACARLERTATSRIRSRSRGADRDGLGRAGSGIGCTAADRRAFLECARAGRMGRRP